jgi:O-antigen/teichoic acid export membrane protein
MPSLRSAATFSVVVQLACRAIGFIANILLLRWLAPDWIGSFTLIVGTAQSLSSFARLGTDYTFQVSACKLPLNQRGGLQRQFLIWNSVFSAIATAVAWPLLQPSLHDLGRAPLPIFLICAYLFVESYVDVLWEPILASRRYHQVFGRHLQVAITKGFLPLFGGLIWGWWGLLFGLLLASSFNALTALKALMCLPSSAGASLPFVHFIRDGLPFYAVPMVQQLVFWPALLSLGDNNGLASLGLIRVAQLMVQLVGVLPAAIAPILMIESAHLSDQAMHRLARSVRIMSIFGVLAFGAYCLVDTTVLPLLFGSSYHLAVAPARAMVLAAVYGSLTQLFQQQGFQSRALVQICSLQIIVLLVCAPLGLILLLPMFGPNGFALLTLVVSYLTLCAMFFWDRQRVLRSSANLIPGVVLAFAPLALLPVFS